MSRNIAAIIMFSSILLVSMYLVFVLATAHLRVIQGVMSLVNNFQ